jgi:hypothetical protein
MAVLGETMSHRQRPHRPLMCTGADGLGAWSFGLPSQAVSPIPNRAITTWPLRAIARRWAGPNNGSELAPSGQSDRDCEGGDSGQFSLRAQTEVSVLVGRSGEMNAPVACQYPPRVVSNLPRVAVGVDEDA